MCGTVVLLHQVNGKQGEFDPTDFWILEKDTIECQSIYFKLKKQLLMTMSMPK